VTVPKCLTGSLVGALKLYGASSPPVTLSAPTNSPAYGARTPRTAIQGPAFSSRTSDLTWNRVFGGEATAPAHKGCLIDPDGYWKQRLVKVKE